MAKYEFLTISMLSYSDVLKLRDIISQLCRESPEVAQAIAREIQECMRANLNRESSNLPASSSRRAGRQQKGVRKPRSCSHKSALPRARVLLAWDLPQSTDHSKVVPTPRPPIEKGAMASLEPLPSWKALYKSG
jgi:hypothetical protein